MKSYEIKLSSNITDRMTCLTTNWLNRTLSKKSFHWLLEWSVKVDKWKKDNLISSGQWKSISQPLYTSAIIFYNLWQGILVDKAWEKFWANASSYSNTVLLRILQFYSCSLTHGSGEFLTNRRARARPLAKARAKLNQNVYYAAYCHQWVIPSRLPNKLDLCFGSQSNYMVYQRMIEK